MAVRKRVAPAASGISTHAEYTRLLQLKTKEEIKAHLEGVLNTLMDLAFAQKSNSSKSAAEQIKGDRGQGISKGSVCGGDRGTHPFFPFLYPQGL